MDSKIIEDFCDYTEIKIEEFYEVLDWLYNKEVFEKNEFGQWRLRRENIEERRNPHW